MTEFEIWFNDLKEETQKALLKCLGIQWPDEARLYDQPLALLETETFDVQEIEKTQEKYSIKVENIFESLDKNEKFGLSFGLFPARLLKYKLDNEESAALIEISQEKTGIEF